MRDYIAILQIGGTIFLRHVIFVQVTSPYGNNLHHNENVTQGQFAFTTTESGNYVACFWMGGNQQEGATASVNLDWKTGIAAKDWDSVAKKEKIEVNTNLHSYTFIFHVLLMFINQFVLLVWFKGVGLELLKLEGIVDAIHQYLTYLKDK